MMSLPFLSPTGRFILPWRPRCAGDDFSLKGIGVDIVSVTRIRRRLNAVSSKEWKARVLTPKEREVLKNCPRDWMALLLAKILTAKEAFFKASGQNWLGPQEFDTIEVNSFLGRQFQVAFINSRPTIRNGGEGIFFRHGVFVGACVVCWE